MRALLDTLLLEYVMKLLSYFFPSSSFRLFCCCLSTICSFYSYRLIPQDPVDPHTMWVNPFGRAFSQMRRSDLIRIDYDGNVLEGGPNKLLNRAAVLIHAAVHKARPDVNCAAHTHSLYGRTFATLGMPLPITSQDGCAFYKDLAYYGAFEGIVHEGSEGENIARAIGSKKAAILQNHGLLTASNSIEATVFWYVSLEKLCQTQLLAMAAASYSGTKIVEVGDKEAAE